MCVGAMEGVGGRGDSFSEDMGTYQSSSGDELDIVGEYSFDESADEGHMGSPSPSAPFCPIVECAGLSRASWVNLDVVLVNDSGVAVAEGICRYTHPQDCIDENPLAPRTLELLYWNHSYIPK